MKKIFLEIFKEASYGRVIISGDPYKIAFNTITPEFLFYINDLFPTLVVNNNDQFYSKLEEYVLVALKSEVNIPKYILNNYKDTIKILVSYIFVNASVDDFSNPISLIDRKINYFKNAILNENLVIELDSFKNSNLLVEFTTQSVFMETPKKMKPSLLKDASHYDLPEVSYGINKENGELVCYIYSILNKNNDFEPDYSKKVKREMYKLNSCIEPSYNSEILSVSPSAAFSLSIMISLLQKRGIKNIKVVPYLPLRSLARNLSLEENFCAEKETRNLMIQQNCTEKFLNTFSRMDYHFSAFNIELFPFDIDSYMYATIDQISDVNNDIIKELNYKILTK